MFWAPMHEAQVPKVWALQNGWKPCILWHSSRKFDSRLRSGCTEQGYITTAMIKFIIKYSIPLTVSCWIYLGCTESIWRDCEWEKSDLSIIQSFITVLVLFTRVWIKFISANNWIFNSNLLNQIILTIEYWILVHLIRSFWVLNIQFWST